MSEDFRRLLSGVAPQERKPLRGIKIVDLDLGIGDVLTGASARRWDGVTGNRIVPDVDLGGSCACETLMGSDEGVVSESVGWQWELSTDTSFAARRNGTVSCR